MVTAAETPLIELARAYGVATEIERTGVGPSPVSEDVLRAVLKGLGVAAGSDDECRSSLEAWQDEQWTRALPRFVVLRETWTPWVPVRLERDADFSVEIFLEDGGAATPKRVERWVAPRTIDGVDYAEFTFEMPGDLPLGYHELMVTAGATLHRCPLIVTPQTMTVPTTLTRRRAWGVATHLYAVRSDRSWGIGDAADLAELGTWAATQGADYVNVGPVTADEPVPAIDPDPYRPVSRITWDPLAIRVEEVREIGYLSAAEHQLLEWHADDARRLNAGPEIDRDAVWRAKRAALRMIWTIERSQRRRRDFERFIIDGGQSLRDYATWCALAHEHGLPWTSWPSSLQDPRSDAVAEFRAKNADAVEFEMWLQWVARTQFADAQREVKAAGMRIGLMHDVPAGVIDGGFEQWARAEAFAAGVRVGARAADGTVTALGLAAQKPPALTDDGLAAWRAVLAHVLPTSGAIRLDRADMLFRQWWMPVEGVGQREGTYVRFEHEALIGVLLLEAHREGAVVVAGDEHEGEDTPWIRQYLADRGIVTTASAAPASSAATASTVPEPTSAETFRTLPPRAMALVSAKDGLPAAARHRAHPDVDERVIELHRHLASAPSILLAVRVGDLVGESRPTAWRFPLAGPSGDPVGLDSLMVSRRAKRVLRAVTDGKRPPRSP